MSSKLSSIVSKNDFLFARTSLQAEQCFTSYNIRSSPSPRECDFCLILINTVKIKTKVEKNENICSLSAALLFKNMPCTQKWAPYPVKLANIHIIETESERNSWRYFNWLRNHWIMFANIVQLFANVHVSAFSGYLSSFLHCRVAVHIFWLELIKHMNYH